MIIDTAKQLFGEQGKGTLKIGANGGGVAFKGILAGSKTHDWGNITAGSEVTTTITVTGAAVGDPVIGYAQAVWTNTNDSIIWSAYVSAADTVTVTLTNTHATTAVDFPSTTITAVVFDIT